MNKKNKTTEHQIGEFCLTMIAMFATLFIGTFALVSAMALATKLFV